MTTYGDKIKFHKYGGIVFANEITSDSENYTLLNAQKIVATDDADLLDTVIKQRPARHVRAILVKLRSRT